MEGLLLLESLQGRGSLERQKLSKTIGPFWAPPKSANAFVLLRVPVLCPSSRKQWESDSSEVSQVEARSFQLWSFGYFSREPRPKIN
eukprot:5553961-Pyramimonas_sp.AAC.1